ncbi:MAG: sucrase ferredoxin [Actinomycetota bacterium]
MTDTAYDPALLPPTDESPRCAEHAADIDLDPAGSALWVDEVLMIDVPLPWPKPVWAADGVTHIPEAVLAAEEHGRRVRALAAVPLDDGISRIVAYERVDGFGPMVRREWRTGPERIGALADRLLRDGLDVADLDLVEVGDAGREVAICAQGSHDICCGADGMRLVGQLEAVRPWVTVRKVSHTGGHRYAPTGLTFPDGRMWGFVSVEEMAAILDRDGRPSLVAERCRGWMGAERIGQVAERAALMAIDDWSVDDVAREVEVVADDGGWHCVVTVVGRTFDVRVERGRAVPTIACRADGGLPAKPGTEFTVASITERWEGAVG